MSNLLCLASNTESAGARSRARTICLVRRCVALPTGIEDGGVFLSNDADETWSDIFHESQHVYDVTVDEKNPRVLYNDRPRGELDAHYWRQYLARRPAIRRRWRYRDAGTGREITQESLRRFRPTFN